MAGRHQRIIAMGRRVQRLLGLSQWDIRFHVGPTGEKEGGGVLGGTEALPEYFAADIYIDPDRAVAEGEDLHALVRHELLHVVLSPLVAVADELAKDNPLAQHMVQEAHERVTSMLEKAPLWKELP